MRIEGSRPRSDMKTGLTRGIAAVIYVLFIVLVVTAPGFLMLHFGFGISLVPSLLAGFLFGILVVEIVDDVFGDSPRIRSLIKKVRRKRHD